MNLYKAARYKCTGITICYYGLSSAVRGNHDHSTSIDISRANSLTDELDYMTDNIPLPVVKAQ